MIFITTSNGVFRLQAEDPAPQLVLPRRKGFLKGILFFPKPSGGFFGIAPHHDGESFLAASRERLGTPRKGKPWTDTRLYRVFVDAQRQPEPVVDLRDVHDVHQIATAGPNAGSLVILTDTGLNRVVLHDLDTGRTWHRNVGDQREDINHLNAVHVDGERVLLGLNNRGNKPAEVLEVALEDLRDPGNAGDLLEVGSLKALGDQLHTHDIEPFAGSLLYCASHDGQVHRVDDGSVVLELGGWVRGLVQTDDGLWVGASPLAERSQRHREDLDGHVHLFDAETLEKKRSWLLKGAGQVNDLVGGD
jgi:hypothetical protein